MSHKGYGRFVNKCMACGRLLEGFFSKRFLLVNGHAVGYVCYGSKVCGNPEKRQQLIEMTEKFSNEFQLFSERRKIEVL